MGVPNPRFFRSSRSLGSRSFSDSLKICLSRPPRTLIEAGIEAASSTKLWSSKGTLHSKDTAMLILSVSISKSSGSWVCASTENIRLRSSVLPAIAKAPASGSVALLSGCIISAATVSRSSTCR